MITFTQQELNGLKGILEWGTYGKGGVEHCGGRCPEHQLRYIRLIDADTEHLQAILRNQRQVYKVADGFVAIVIRSILQERGVAPEPFSHEAEFELFTKAAEGLAKHLYGDNTMNNSKDAYTGIDAPDGMGLNTSSDDTSTSVDTRNMIFVFGSNEEGRHGGGAAKTARLHHGAIWGQGEGLQGSSYGIPTCHKPSGQPGWQLSLQEVHQHIQNFLDYAAQHPELTFQVTQIGCGLAGWTADQMAPLFVGASDNCYFDKAWESYLGPDAKYWGTF